MLSPRETATVLAALLHWREEMCPHGAQIMRPYFEHFHLTRYRPLHTDEITRLCRRLQASLRS